MTCQLRLRRRVRRVPARRLQSGRQLDVDLTCDEEVQSEQDELWLRQVEEETSAIEALPFVKGNASFIYGLKAGEVSNDSKVMASVWCCWAQARRTFKQVVAALRLEERPTHLEALRELRAKLVREHGGDNHIHDSKAVARRRELWRVR